MTKKNKKKTKFIYKLLSLLLIIASALSIIGIITLNILNMKYFMIVVGIILFINLVSYLWMIKSKKKKSGTIFSFFFLIVFSILSFYIFETNGMLNNILSHHKVYTYKVIVRTDSDYKQLSDLDKNTMGYFNNKTEETDKAIKHIDKKITPDYKEYDDINKLTNSLLSSEIESIVIEESYYNMITEENSDFIDNTKVIYTFKIRQAISDFSKDVDVSKKPFNIFISGIDTYGSIDSVSRSDVNMVVTINPKTKQILMTGIPRDYYVQLHGINGYKDKLTHAGLYGVDNSVQTIEDFLGININYYVKVNFSSVVNIVNTLNGVEVYSEYDFTSIDGYHYSRGYNKVNGEEALSFARERKAFSAGDNQRIKNQQALLQALVKKAISKDIIYKYSKLLNNLSDSFVTNMSPSRITSLIRMQLDDMADWNITSNSLTGEGELNYTYSYPSQKLYVMVPDTDSITKTKELIDAVFNGDTLESSYDENTGTTHIVTKSQPTPNTSNNNTEKKEESKKEVEKTSETNTSQTDEPEEIEGTTTSNVETSSTIGENNTSSIETPETSTTEVTSSTEIEDNNN